MFERFLSILDSLIYMLLNLYTNVLFMDKIFQMEEDIFWVTTEVCQFPPFFLFKSNSA